MQKYIEEIHPSAYMHIKAKKSLIIYMKK